MQFSREQEKLSTSNKEAKSLLQEAQSWEIRLDLRKKLVFPQVIQTSLRSDIVRCYEEPKKIILIELMVLWEVRCEVASEGKSTNYHDLLHRSRDRVNSGRPDCSRWRWAAGASLHSQYGECSQAWELQKRRGRWWHTGLGRLQKEPLAGFGVGGRSWAGSREKITSDWPSLLTHQLEVFVVKGWNTHRKLGTTWWHISLPKAPITYMWLKVKHQ